MKIICLTPTGDRFESLALARYYFARAKSYFLEQRKVDIEWVVVDDGIEPFNPSDCTYLRREPDGPNSLGRNLHFAFANGALEADFILMWEDDDWYAPSRIVNQVKALNKSGLHGYKQSIYFNLKHGVYQHENFTHSSLFETAMRKETAQQFQVIVNNHINEPFLDLRLWKEAKGKLSEQLGLCVGIKGQKGRAGLGSGHGDTLPYTKALLKDYIGGDEKYYKVS